MATPTSDLLDRPDVLNVLFYPRRDFGVPLRSETVHPIAIPVAEGIDLGGIAYAGGPEAPVILYFHGNGEIASDYVDIASLYTRIGVTLFVVDYRAYGASGGQPSSSGLIADAMPVFEQTPALLAQNGVACPRLFVMGRSLGSAPALEIAQRAGNRIAGLIIESGFAYTIALIERLSGRTLHGADEERDGFGNLRKIRQVRTPTLIIHGEEDWIIPVEDGIALHEACGAAEKTLMTMPRAGHNDLLLLAQRRYFQAIHDFVFGPPARG